jgi:pimeloyl-ACP methyl ester carboxylesterase
VTSRTAHLPTRSVRYLEAGEGQPLLLLHAFPFSADQWLPQLSRIPRGWRAVAPDLRGVGGESPGVPPGGTISMDTYAGDALELMAHLDMPRAVVCGLSMGGYVALAMVRRSVERISGLVLADTRAAADSADGRAGRERMLALLGREGPPGVAREMLPKLLSDRSRREQPDLEDVLKAMIEANASEGIAAAIRAMKERPDSMGILGRIACPTLVIVGKEDALTPPAEAEILQRGIAGARLHTIPGAGHMSNLEAPLAFSSALEGLLGAVEPGRA